MKFTSLALLQGDVEWERFYPFNGPQFAQERIVCCAINEQLSWRTFGIPSPDLTQACIPIPRFRKDLQPAIKNWGNLA
jgi:hypothetical protein